MCFENSLICKPVNTHIQKQKLTNKIDDNNEGRENEERIY